MEVYKVVVHERITFLPWVHFLWEDFTAVGGGGAVESLTFAGHLPLLIYAFCNFTVALALI